MAVLTRAAVRRSVGLLLWSAAAPALSQAAHCPWLSAATAGGVLLADASETTTVPASAGTAAAEGVCTFTAAQDGAGTPSLRIQVSTIADVAGFANVVAHCPAVAARMTGVGNEAVVCALREGSGSVEQVIGRVRRRVFEMRWVVPDGSKGAAESAEMRSAAVQNTAEQVAGSLF